MPPLLTYKDSPYFFVTFFTALLPALLLVIPLYAMIQHIIIGEVIRISWSISMALLNITCPNGIPSKHPSA